MSGRALGSVIRAELRLAWRPGVAGSAAVALAAAGGSHLFRPGAEMAGLLSRVAFLAAFFLPVLVSAGVWRGPDATPLHRLLIAAGWSRWTLLLTAATARLGSATVAVILIHIVGSSHRGSSAEGVAMILVSALNVGALATLVGIVTTGWQNVTVALALSALGFTFAPDLLASGTSSMVGRWITLLVSPFGWWLPPFGPSWETVIRLVAISVGMVCLAAVAASWTTP